MNYENQLRDFVRRTRENLALTDKWRRQEAGAEFNEVTHLINYLLGLVVLPSEGIQQFIVQERVTEAGVPKWQASFKLTGQDPPTDMRSFLTGLRNAVAHGHLEFESDGQDITGVRFTQTAGRRGAPLWSAIFRLDDLRIFLERLADEVENACDRQQHAT